jgi:hypothetical protein
MGVVDDSFGYPLKLEEGASGPLAGGILQYGYQCGMLWGAALAAGAQAYRLHGPGPGAEAQALAAAQRLLEIFRLRNHGEMNCLEITHLNLHGKTAALPILKFLVKGGPIRCFSMSAAYARQAFDEINQDGLQKPVEAPAGPVSCAAVLARRMGASDQQAVMAAGLAGGIGLSGGACGALGAAIWIIGLRHAQQTGAKMGFGDPLAAAAVERFLESADYEFECQKIVGRRFESAADHAAYLRQGGCSQLIEALAAA